MSHFVGENRLQVELQRRRGRQRRDGLRAVDLDVSVVDLTGVDVEGHGGDGELLVHGHRRVETLVAEDDDVGVATVRFALIVVLVLVAFDRAEVGKLERGGETGRTSNTAPRVERGIGGSGHVIETHPL